MTNPSHARVRAPRSFKLFRRGYADWLRERMFGPAPGEEPVPKGKGDASVVWLLLVIPFFILLATFLFPLIAPGLAAGLRAAGSQAVTIASITVSVVSGAAFVIGLPVLWLRRFYRFVIHCCERGLALADGSRLPAPSGKKPVFD